RCTLRILYRVRCYSNASADLCHRPQISALCPQNRRGHRGFHCYFTIETEALLHSVCLHDNLFVCLHRPLHIVDNCVGRS
ncbi:hypothetical protein PENTCL1PPCAC_13415, partial [Pristionchus entomophagus]